MVLSGSRIGLYLIQIRGTSGRFVRQIKPHTRWAGVRSLGGIIGSMDKEQAIGEPGVMLTYSSRRGDHEIFQDMSDNE